MPTGDYWRMLRQESLFPTHDQIYRWDAGPTSESILVDEVRRLRDEVAELRRLIEKMRP